MNKPRVPRFAEQLVEANLKDGMLHLAIPRTPEPEAKRIEVRTSS